MIGGFEIIASKHPVVATSATPRRFDSGAKTVAFFSAAEGMMKSVATNWPGDQKPVDITAMVEGMRKIREAGDPATLIEASPDLSQALMEAAVTASHGVLGFGRHGLGHAVKLEVNDALVGMTGIIHYTSGRKAYV